MSRHPKPNALVRYLRTPKGLFTIILALLTAIAVPHEGLALVAPPLLGATLAAMLVARTLTAVLVVRALLVRTIVVRALVMRTLLARTVVELRSLVVRALLARRAALAVGGARRTRTQIGRAHV